MPTFFPNLPFGWLYYAVLIAFLLVAAYIDSRRMVVPKKLSLTVLALGILFNLARLLDGRTGPQSVAVRTQWCSHGCRRWLPLHTGWVFHWLWHLFRALDRGSMPGGDVKLFAAVSAWVGPDLAVWILALSTIILMVLLMGKLAITFLTPRSQAAPPTRTDRKGKAPVPRDPRLRAA